MPRILQTIIAALAVAPVTLGHTWIEQLRNVNEKGQYVGEYGYPRGMFSKTDPGFDGFKMNFEIPAYQGKVFIQNDTMLCHKEQRQQKQSQDKYPRLQAAPGGFIAMRYMENGHITLPQNQKGKPEKAGTIFIYGTTQPKEDEKISTVLRWTEDGKGGNGQGVLLAMNDFDDGRCYENNNSPTHKERVVSSPNYAMGQAEDGPGTMPLFCDSNVQLPKTAAKGKPYTFYWVWQWNTAPGGIDPGYPKGKDEYYSTCIDVDVTSQDIALAADAKPKYALGQQDAMSIAVKDWSARTALMTDALQGEVGPIFGGGKQTPAPSAPGGSPSAKPSAPGAPAPSGKPPKASDEPAIPTVTGRPGRPGRPSAAPTSKSFSGPVTTVTDTVFITMTAPVASQSAPPAAVTSKSAASFKSKAPPARVTPPASASRATPGVVAPSAGIPPPPAGAPDQLPGFNMRNPNGAKFRAMFK
ncbi:hypothetical protein DE146DRAFT_396455 [Phaeosphaeria sp. MPI-PUGE-AT-0046c]|nr:hypothetical protein DE146DRAFT_396455 [Phaeosphaeria sp. MPI-PUGE-AT-0046c]